MLPEYTRDELAAGLDRVAEKILADMGVRAPPVDAFAVAQALGIALAWDDRQEGRARYVRLSSGAGAGRATILLRPDPRLERQQWAVAHEIGEHAACRVFAHWGVDPRATSAGAREAVANAMAGRLLLPTAWFAADAAACDWDLIALKARYHTASHELIARRMLECRPPVIISIFDHRKIMLSAQQPSRPGAAAIDRRDGSVGGTFTSAASAARLMPVAGLFRVGRSTRRDGSEKYCGPNSTSGRPMGSARRRKCSRVTRIFACAPV